MLLRAVVKYLAVFPLTILDVLVAQTPPAADPPPDPAAGAEYHGPITACPLCGETLICREVALQELEQDQ